MIRFRPDIEGLRAVAVFLVIFNHLEIPGFRGGFVGVDVFFVISGYLITSLLASEYREKAAERHGYGSISIPHFYARRARRILPAALTVIAAVVVASRYLLNPLRGAEIQHDALWAALFGANINSINQATDYFTQGLATSPLQHYWSLAVEEQFYLVWPAVFLLVVMRWHGLTVFGRVIRWDRRVAIAVGLIGIASLAYSIHDTSTNPTDAYFSTFTRGWELALGASIGIATSRTTALPRPLATLLSLLGVSLLVVSCLLINSGTAFPGIAALGPTAAAACLILGGIDLKQPLPNRGLAVAPLRFLGRISYSLYLWHWPLIVFALALYPVVARSVTGRMAILALTLATSVVSYYGIERPFRRFSFDFPEPIRRYAVPVGVAAFLVSVSVVFVAEYNRISGASYVNVPAAVYAATTPPNSGVQPAPSTPKPRASSGARLFTTWQAKIRQGLALNQLPADLQPLTDHLQPVPEWLSPCQNYRAAIFQHIPECRWGNPAAARVIAVVGDSHAAMWMTTIKGALNPRTSVVYQFTRNWCGWATNPGRAGTNADCPALQRATLAYLHSLKPRVIILSEAGAPDANSMVDALTKYEKIAPHVLVIGHTPSLPSWDSCLSADNGITSCQGRADLSVPELEQATAANSGARYIDPTPWLCSSSNLCPPIIAGVPVFVLDGDHFTLPFAQRLVPLMQFELRAARVL